MRQAVITAEIQNLLTGQPEVRSMLKQMQTADADCIDCKKPISLTEPIGVVLVTAGNTYKFSAAHVSCGGSRLVEMDDLGSIGLLGPSSAAQSHVPNCAFMLVQYGTYIAGFSLGVAGFHASITIPAAGKSVERFSRHFMPVRFAHEPLGYPPSEHASVRLWPNTIEILDGETRYHEGYHPDLPPKWREAAREQGYIILLVGPGVVDLVGSIGRSRRPGLIELPKDTYGVLANFVDFASTRRNDKCPCNSGKKFKKCHDESYDEPYSDGVLPADERIVTFFEGMGQAESPWKLAASKEQYLLHVAGNSLDVEWRKELGDVLDGGHAPRKLMQQLLEKSDRCNSPQLLLPLEIMDRSIPAALARQTENIYVGATQHIVPNARAWASTADGRVIEWNPGLSNLIEIGTITLHRALDATLRHSESKGEEPIISELAESFVRELIDEAESWNTGVRSNSNMRDLYVRDNPERQTAIIKTLHEARTFALLHEVAHHLLGHTHPASAPYGKEIYLGQDLLRIALDLPYFEISTENPLHRLEIEADLFAILARSGTLSGAPTFADWSAAIMGAMTALPALEMYRLGRYQLEEGENPRQLYTSSHPSLVSRVDHLERLIRHIPQSSMDHLQHPWRAWTTAAIIRFVFLSAWDQLSGRPANMEQIISRILSGG